ncbi:polysaccharide synthase [Diplocarpon rosae]|nr:polysaccharide synthase [Diplocarpon rosae]
MAGEIHSSTMLLGAMCMWGLADYSINKHYSDQYEPVPVQHTPAFTTQDVSVVVRTFKPHPVFKTCLLKWIENTPLEIIICTAQEYFDDVSQIIADAGLRDTDLARVTTIIADKGAQKQLLAGITMGKGNIIATSDNHIEWAPTCLSHMLACFADPKVGAAAPQIKVKLSEERKALVGPWEVAATKLADRGPGSATVMHVAAKWCWTLAGTSGVYRAEILKDPGFASAYLGDTWRGVMLDVGEDTFISRWLLKHGWVIATQYKDETAVYRTVKQTGALVQQMLRWERSTIQSFLRTVKDIPGWCAHPLVAIRTVERILKAPLLWFHLGLWCFSFNHNTLIASLLLAYYAYWKYVDYKKFVGNYP